MLQDSQGQVFVKIPDQVDLRMNMLESAKLTAYLLKKYARIVQLNKQKKKEVFKVKMLFSEAKSKLTALEFKDISWLNSSSEEKKENFKSVKRDERLKVQKDKLTQDLEEIEKRLNSLKF